MTAYINKGKRNFIIKKGNEKVILEPLQIVDLNEKEYSPLKNFKEIEALQEAKTIKIKEKEQEKTKETEKNKQEIQNINGNNK